MGHKQQYCANCNWPMTASASIHSSSTIQSTRPSIESQLPLACRLWESTTDDAKHQLPKHEEEQDDVRQVRMVLRLGGKDADRRVVYRANQHRSVEEPVELLACGFWEQRAVVARREIA